MSAFAAQNAIDICRRNPSGSLAVTSELVVIETVEKEQSARGRVIGRRSGYDTFRFSEAGQK